MTPVTVNDGRGYWIDGPAHFFYYRDPTGQFVDETAREVGDTLIWNDGEITYRLESQLETMTSELVTRRELVFVDVANEQLSVNPIFSWREPIFTKSLADKAPAIYASRSPLERSVLALIGPLLVPTEAEYLQKNTFRMIFSDFDWKLNDLTGR